MDAVQPKVILIDNDEDDQEIFIMALEKLDRPVDIRVFGNGADVISFLHEGEFVPSHIFIDMNMPLMSGKECLEEIRKMPLLNETEVFIYSTATSPGMANEILGLGAKDFLVKPAAFRELIRLLSGIIFPDVAA